mgnify:CR=1 FL=1
MLEVRMGPLLVAIPRSCKRKDMVLVEEKLSWPKKVLLLVLRKLVRDLRSDFPPPFSFQTTKEDTVPHIPPIGAIGRAIGSSICSTYLNMLAET